MGQTHVICEARSRSAVWIKFIRGGKHPHNCGAAPKSGHEVTACRTPRACSARVKGLWSARAPCTQWPHARPSTHARHRNITSLHSTQHHISPRALHQHSPHRLTLQAPSPIVSRETRALDTLSSPTYLLVTSCGCTEEPLGKLLGLFGRVELLDDLERELQARAGPLPHSKQAR